ncbi:aromatic-ring-hydroxylating dioxygenase subunit beta [Pseudomonas sp. LRF_L74]|uniref:aromatic-ring-hydroxylating dioxygenase subunit beta n=1 Tax=Pseudomonas sp. LRF_L74 TaxID=3369422 RepID=UPI003F6459D5
MSRIAHAQVDDLHARVSDFIVNEAELLDERQLDHWFALFEPEARYRVLPLQAELDGQPPEASLYIIADDYIRLRERVESLLGGHSWMEQPRSRTRRLVSNVRIKARDGERITVRSNFVVHQFRNQESWSFVGQATHLLRDGPERLSILARDIRLDHETIGAQRRISIIL